MEQTPDRRSTRLIILEGIMGSGKSTSVRYVAKGLQERGVDARFLGEEIAPHPIRVDDVLPRPYQPWLDVTVDDYIERSGRNWEAFVAERDASDAVTILDGQLFHGDLTNLFMMEANRAQLDRQIAQITQITAGLNPAVINLTSADIPKAMQIVFQARGPAWEKYQVDWKTQSPYCKARDFDGYEGLVRMYQDYRALTDDLFAALPMKKIRIDPSGGDWPRYHEQMFEFLGESLSYWVTESER